MEKLDLRLQSFKKLYEMANIGNRFESDLEKGVIAKIDIDKHNFRFEDYAQLSTSINVLDGKRFRYFVFKEGYFYKNNKFFLEQNGTKRIISKVKVEHIK